MKKPLLTKVLILCALFFSIGEMQAQFVRISGVVKDDITKETLIGANVIVDSLFIGAATDVNGKFEISGIPARPFVLVIKFIGYEEKRMTFKTAPNQPLTINLSPISIMGEEVVVTALARGQMGAVNTQLNALQIKNVVSAAKMSEIPDATAAEAIGRLPGLSIERSGGEANKVSVRGLGSKHNTMSVEGVTLLSTDAENRSVDISMIAPNVLSGVEVTKALTPDLIASSLGGAVDMTLKTAQEGDLQLDASAQGGYNTNISALSDYKISLALGKRFMDNKFGVMFGGYIENRYRGKDIIDPTWVRDERIPAGDPSKDSTLRFSKMNYQNIDDNRFRYGGSLVLDYQLPFGQIKLINFGSRMNLTSTTYSQDFEVIGAGHNYSIEQSGNDYRTQIVNKIAGDFNLFTGKLSLGFSHSMAERNNPERIKVGGWGDFNEHPTMGDVLYRDSLAAIPNFDFREWVNYLNVNDANDKSGIHQSAANIDFMKDFGIDREFTTQIDYKVPFNIENIMSGFIKAGYMHKYHTRKYNYDQKKVDVASSGINHDADLALKTHFSDIYTTIPSSQGKIDPEDAWTNDFNQDNFFDGKYNLYPFMALDHMKDYAYYGRQYYQDNGYYLYPNISSYEKDQDGVEVYDAGYIMAELKFWKDRINIIPGIRYERQTYQYDTKRITVPFQGSAPDLTTYVRDTTSALLVHENFFPSVQAIIKPFEWVDIRLAYGNTVSRPDYNAMIPRYSLNPNGLETEIKAGNQTLRPQLSENLDAQVSFYGKKLGLITVGVFHKNLTDLIEKNNYYILDTTQANFHNLPHTVLTRGVVGGSKAPVNYEYTLNNKWDKKILGFEFDYQPNLHYLPYPFNGLLFNVNCTYRMSEYERYNYLVKQVLTPLFPGSPIKVKKPVSVDTSYVQEDNFFNLNASLGYNYKGFTVHVSYLFIPDNLRKLSATRTTPTEDEYNLTYSRIDVKIKQRINKNLELFLDLDNLTNSGDAYYRNVLGGGDFYIDRDERYGSSFQLGIRYRL